MTVFSDMKNKILPLCDKLIFGLRVLKVVLKVED